MDRALHLILRVPVTGKPLDWIVQQHEVVLRKHAAVWIGIRTCSLSRHLRGQLSLQTDNSIPTFLYLTQRSADLFNVYKAKISASANVLTDGMLALTPPYYADQQLIGDMQSWIKLATLAHADGSELDRLAMYTTGTPLVQVLKASMLSFGSVYLR